MGAGDALVGIAGAGTVFRVSGDVPPGRMITTTSLRVHVREAGAGLPVVLLHGFPQDSWMWRHQLRALSDEWRCIAPDTRGFGLTDKPRVRVTRDLLARDVVELLDALGIERAALVGHDWGGIIASATAFRYPERVTHLGLIDTLCSVWIPWGIHGWWFKDEPRPEVFFEHHARAFIGSLFARRPRDYGGPPETPWAAVAGTGGGVARAARPPESVWTETDVDHYVEVFDHPDVWFNAIEYYRHGLPFHVETADPDARHGRHYGFLSNSNVAAQWNHPGGLTAHPDFPWFPVFAPEDAHVTYAGPTLLLYSSFLAPHAFEGLETGKLPPDDQFEPSDPWAASFLHHFPQLLTRATASGHFVPEEDPDRTTACIRQLLARGSPG